MNSTSISQVKHIAVLIPARNEEALLPRCLRSVLRAAMCLPPEISWSVVVAADACTDGTLQIARAMLRDCGQGLRCTAGNVGAARAAAAHAAMHAQPYAASHCWLANTDADCEVPADWLQRQVRLARGGCTAVAGIVDVDCFAEHLPVVESRFRESYLLHADGTHPHVHGANLGVRADVYLQAGGWNLLQTAEDHDLWQRLLRVSTACVSDARLCVSTSGRRIGRAPLGFAGALAKHNEPAAIAEPA